MARNGLLDLPSRVCHHKRDRYMESRIGVQKVDLRSGLSERKMPHTGNTEKQSETLGIDFVLRG